MVCEFVGLLVWIWIWREGGWEKNLVERLLDIIVLKSFYSYYLSNYIKDSKMMNFNQI